jgi:hypothetical protein
MCLQQSDFAPPKFGSVLYIVVNKECVVKEFQRGGRQKRLLGAASGSAARGKANGGPEPFSLAKGIIGEHVIQRAVARATPFGKQLLQFAQDFAAGFREDAVNEFDVVAHS